jgi:hypothetical protein
MRNRAKCKLCQSIIESFYPGHVDTCKCGAITVFNGEAMDMAPFNSPHFLRVDEIGNEIVVSYKEKGAEGQGHEEADNPNEPLSRADLIKDFENAIEYIDKAPDHEQYSFVTNAALCHYMKALVNILKRD